MSEKELQQDFEYDGEMKKSTKIVITIIVVFLLGFNFWYFIGGAMSNDIKAEMIKKKYYALTLPEETELIEVKTFVGNSSGTGNHNEIWVGMLVKTQQTEDTLKNHFDGYEVYQAILLETGEVEWIEKPIMINFKISENKVGYGNYYIVGNFYEAVTQQDLRGH